jgi:phospholipid transport system substrate-binding protein
MKRLLFLTLISFMIGIFSLQCYAQSSPMDMLQNTSDHMLAELKVNKATLKSNPKKVFDIVDRILLPHIDMTTMSKSVVGRNLWNSASTQDQQIFIKEFTELLIRTYASAIASYTNQSVQFFPIRGGWQGQQQLQVNSQINQPNGPPIPMSYRLILQGSQWKVIDISVDNVSIVQNYRAQFANDLNQGGLAKLNTKLSQHNDQLAAQD